MNLREAHCQLFKGTLFAAGVGLAIGGLYSVTKLYEKGSEYYHEYKSDQKFEQQLKTDTRFANGLTLTKFCLDIHSSYNTEKKQ